MTTIKLSGGDLGSETVRVRCDLSRAESPVEADYGDGWQPTQYQCADCRHSNDGLGRIGERLAARACEMDVDGFSCEWRVATTRDEALALISGTIDGDDVIYYDDATGHYWRSDADDLDDLAALMDDDDADIRRDAYSHWCAGTSSDDLGTYDEARAAGHID